MEIGRLQVLGVVGGEIPSLWLQLSSEHELGVSFLPVCDFRALGSTASFQKHENFSAAVRNH